MSKMQYHGVGKRKSAIARVYLTKGKGEIEINKRPLHVYFPRLLYQKQLRKPFYVTNTLGEYDVKVNVKGGGPTGQAEAIRLGIARALLKVNSELRLPLKKAGLLTRDARVVERKKYGLHKARRAPQYSKR